MDITAESKLHLAKDQWITLLLPLTLFFLPISSSLKSILFGASLVSILLVKPYRTHILQCFSMPVVRRVFYFYFFILLAAIWSPASFHQKLFVLEKYSRFLYLPILMVGFQHQKTRQASLYAFIAAMCFVCGLSTLKHLGFLNQFAFDPNFVFRNHIITGIMASFAAYLAAVFCYRAKGQQKLYYLPIIFLLSYQVLFVGSGRTGYVIYCVLFLTFFAQFCSFKKLVLSTSLFASLITFSYLNSDIMQTRVSDTIHQVKSYQTDNKNTELGLRFQFHHFAFELFKRHPIIGNGSASFTYLFSKENPVPFWTNIKGKHEGPHRLLEPHSQYWLVAAELGLVGLLLYALFWGGFIRCISTLSDMKPIAIALAACFLTGTLTDSLLFYSGTGYFFLLLLSLCLGELIHHDTKDIMQ